MLATHNDLHLITNLQHQGNHMCMLVVCTAISQRDMVDVAVSCPEFGVATWAYPWLGYYYVGLCIHDCERVAHLSIISRMPCYSGRVISIWRLAQ